MAERDLTVQEKKARREGAIVDFSRTIRENEYDGLRLAVVHPEKGDVDAVVLTFDEHDTFTRRDAAQCPSTCFLPPPPQAQTSAISAIILMHPILAQRARSIKHSARCRSRCSPPS